MGDKHNNLEVLCWPRDIRMIAVGVHASVGRYAQCFVCGYLGMHNGLGD